MKKKILVLEKVRLTTAGAKGKAVGRHTDGKVVFVSNAVPGDVCDVRVIKKKSKYYEGIPLAIHEYSAERTDAPCKHFGVCGGCKWQNMQYSQQLHYKQDEVINNLKRLGGLQINEHEEILGSAQIFNYRNKMEYSFSSSRWLTEAEIETGDTFDKNALGFHVPGRWDKVMNVEECYLQASPGNEIRNSLRSFCRDRGFSFFHPHEQTGLMRTLMIRNTDHGQLMVLVQFGENNMQQINEVMDFLKQSFPQINSLLYTINLKRNDTLFDQEIITFNGLPYIIEEMQAYDTHQSPLQFRIGAKSFYQTNSAQASVLYRKALEYADLKGDELLYDLYTGTGTIALYAARLVKKVVGIEWVEAAIVDARINAEVNGISNATFYAGDMKDLLTPAFMAKEGKPDVVITDPPRDGMHKSVVETLLQMAPKKIVYVSCNSATQARDIALMQEYYTVEKLVPVDMFPHTFHVESIVLLLRK